MCMSEQYICVCVCAYVFEDLSIGHWRVEKGGEVAIDVLSRTNMEKRISISVCMCACVDLSFLVEVCV